MDKLIRLLQQRTIECGGNEERKLRGGRIYLTRKGRMYPHYDANAIIISKRFGFIRRLVENDKIDFENQAMQYAKEDLSKFLNERKDKNGMSDEYAMILMLLAIQDEPIEFLISILK